LRKLGAVISITMLVAGAALGLTACSDSGKEGGVLRGAFASFPDHLDPQLSYTAEGWNAMYNTYIPLLAYAHASGDAGGEVVPGLAEGLPRISDGGKTYELTLREGLRYSNGTPVRASDFESTVERLFKVDSPGTFYYTGIVGAEEFQKTKSGDIAGIEANDATGAITIRLVEPSGTFTNELALPFVALVPPGTPARSQSANPIPATGPYEIVESNPGRSWTYARNPQWEKANSSAMPDLPGGHIDRIEITVIENQSTQVNDIEQGRLNWMFSPPPADRYAEVKSKYEGTQFRVEPTLNTYYFWMNTRQAPFDDLKVRQAVNYAVDPAALERIYAGQIEGAQQILPPGMPGYEKFTLYPHDMARARQLIAEANPSDRDITVWTESLAPHDDAGAYYQDLLEKLGFNAKLKAINANSYFTVIGNLSTPDIDTGWGNWFVDYPNPASFFGPTMTAAGIAPTGSTNLGQLDVPSLDRRVDELAKQELGSEQAQQYAELDKEYMRHAPWAPFGVRTLSTFVSSDIDFDEVIWSPIFSNDLTSFQFK
jgi:peptide/nickel transport system substrate-binding protein